MGAKVHVLLHVAEDHRAGVPGVLVSVPGIACVDLLEGPPDVMLTIEAETREELAQFTVRALARLETVAEKVDLLVVQSDASVGG